MMRSPLSVLMYLFPVQSEVWYGSHFLCHGRNGCYDDQIHCLDNIKCIVDCYGPNSCQYAVIHCPIDASCDVTCGGGYDSCKDVVFLAKHSASLSITCDRSQSEAFDETLIYCPDNGYGGPISCHISGLSPVNVKAKMEIFAVEGFNDVEISGSYINAATVYCKKDYSSPCTLMNSSPFNQCISSDKTCEHHLKPTSRPTSTPTPTLYPTQTPIRKATLHPTRYPTPEPIVPPTLYPTPEPIYKAIVPPTRYPTPEPIYKPTVSPTLTPTLYPTSPPIYLTLKPTRRPINLHYTPRPTRPIATPRPTQPLWGALGTTTTQEDIALALIDDMDIEDEANTESEEKPNYKVLYYVITALLISICYISLSLFCWVHFNQKYTQRVIELKRRDSQIPLSPKKEHHNRSRFMTASVASSAAPTTEPKPPTTSRSRCSTSTQSSNYIEYPEAPIIIEEDEEEFKEVDYETSHRGENRNNEPPVPSTYIIQNVAQ